MSWEEDYRRERPCFCGKGTIESWGRSDDWNRHESGENLKCEHCRENYVYAFVDPYSAYTMKSDGYAWVTRERLAELKEREEQEKLERKQSRIQDLYQQISEWKGRHTLKWFRIMSEYMELQNKRDTEEYADLMEESRQYNEKLKARREKRRPR